MEMSVAQVMVEVGRLHMENLALRSENDELRAALAVLSGAPQVGLAPSEGNEEQPAADPVSW